MKKIFVLLPIILFLYPLFIHPDFCLAANPGPFVAVKGGSVYHYRNCSDLANTQEIDKIYYVFAEAAIAEGLDPCPRCNPPYHPVYTYSPPDSATLTPTPVINPPHTQSPPPTAIPTQTPTPTTSPTSTSKPQNPPHLPSNPEFNPSIIPFVLVATIISVSVILIIIHHRRR